MRLFLVLEGLVAAAKVGLRLLVLLVLLVDNVLIGDLKLLFLHVGGSHLRHVEDFKHGVEVQVFHIQTFQDYLSDNEVYVLLLQLNLLEEIQEVAFGDRALAVSLCG